MASQHDPREVTEQIQDEIAAVLGEIQDGCSQAMGHLIKSDSLGAIGAVSGMGSRLGYALELLNLQRRWEQITKS